ncbi:MAG: D-alanyl-D-alanine carboxypeptidase family protein [Huintestinicola sp.]|uniref:D-alanyl-D-alanine carboxypeptidase family protein n=1 Tax=Huintestinicola sp. TaxID=2981661 RepID=UPI003F0EEA00
MKRNKISAVILAALTLSACSSVEDVPAETDALPAGGDNVIASEPISDETIAPESTKPAETWADSEEPPIELPVQTEESPADGEITDIELTYYEITLEPGETSMPWVTMYPEDAEDKSEIWSSSDESIAEVDGKGNITALSEGECVIKVQSAVCPHVYAQVNVTVTSEGTEAHDSEEITAIELTYYEITLRPGESSMPRVTMYPEDADDRSEIWSSSDESIARVDDIGNITALSEGECVIKVQSAVSPNVYAEVRVTVIALPAPAETEAAGSSQLTYIDGILIANKTYSLPADYAPGVDPDAQAAFDRMQSAAAAEGLNIYISSGFRSYEYQTELYERYVKKSGKSEADRYSARPGHSEHQTGLAFDLNTIDISFADTAEYDWLKVHCAEYGFLIRYPENGESKTGYMYEPWHIRYLGVDTAKKVYDSGLTLEEYLGIDSKYSE